jgi:hypothetical protein
MNLESAEERHSWRNASHRCIDAVLVLPNSNLATLTRTEAYARLRLCLMITDLELVQKHETGVKWDQWLLRKLQDTASLQQVLWCSNHLDCDKMALFHASRPIRLLPKAEKLPQHKSKTAILTNPLPCANCCHHLDFWISWPCWQQPTTFEPCFVFPDWLNSELIPINTSQGRKRSAVRISLRDGNLNCQLVSIQGSLFRLESLHENLNNRWAP